MLISNWRPKRGCSVGQELGGRVWTVIGINLYQVAKVERKGYFDASDFDPSPRRSQVFGRSVPVGRSFMPMLTGKEIAMSTTLVSGTTL